MGQDPRLGPYRVAMIKTAEWLATSQLYRRPTAVLLCKVRRWVTSSDGHGHVVRGHAQGVPAFPFRVKVSGPLDAPKAPSTLYPGLKSEKVRDWWKKVDKLREINTVPGTNLWVLKCIENFREYPLHSCLIKYNEMWYDTFMCYFLKTHGSTYLIVN